MIKNLTFDEALERLKGRIRSEPLHMSVNLIGHGLKAGRGLSESLFHVADIIQDRENMRRSIATQLHAVETTVILLVVFSAPLLYGCSSAAAEVMSHLSQKIAASVPAHILAQSWMHPADNPVSPAFIETYVLVNLAATALAGSLIVGEVTTGRPTEGLRYMLAMMLSSQLAYLALKGVLSARLTGAFA
jgi:hypothetical protein